MPAVGVDTHTRGRSPVVGALSPSRDEDLDQPYASLAREEPFWRSSWPPLYTAERGAGQTPILEGPPRPRVRWPTSGGVIQVYLTLERETKNTVRFAEDEEGQPRDHPGTPVVGTLYLQKAAHAKLGAPKRITVTIDAKG